MQRTESVGDLFSAVFNGAPDAESAEKYTAQVTALISLYICFVGIFLIGVYIRAQYRRKGLQAERRTFRIWIAFSLLFSVLMIAAYVGVFLATLG